MIIVNADSCPQNHPCPALSYCPTGAISQEDIFSAPSIDQELCTGCEQCVRVCRTFRLVPEEVGVL